MRYLVYPISKHQSSPWFCHAYSEGDISDADACLSVIVDLQERKRYFCGEWKDVDVPKEEKPQ